METGTVKFFNDAKGFGFIEPDNNNFDGKDLFVHASGLVDEIKENDKVIFDTEEGRKGIMAVNVKLA